jgi:hypothetical protein
MVSILSWALIEVLGLFPCLPDFCKPPLRASQNPSLADGHLVSVSGLIHDVPVMSERRRLAARHVLPFEPSPGLLTDSLSVGSQWTVRCLRASSWVKPLLGVRWSCASHFCSSSAEAMWSECKSQRGSACHLRGWTSQFRTTVVRRPGLTHSDPPSPLMFPFVQH